ncbi:ankyrin repeat and fibronectin type-III domain-containing protein 1 [Stegostoma tigrinum]|uniref:ankyrin repeat and fibronectin type-III domain-containing protein 1 n=1 Tax=Stegostoma tigrinum TaxID=3053191 RepID=UPI0028701E83|nr:ankyrin repeat and fibronectin type-III domain-containing protein 1 [Stegostoma tigrinum]
MTEQLQKLNLSPPRRNYGPPSPNAAKRLYRNLSDRFKRSHSSFDDPLMSPKTEKERLKTLSWGCQCNEVIFEAVEQQDLDTVQLLLRQYSVQQLDLNAPNRDGLTPLDIAIMTNQVAIAQSLLRAGANENPHFVSVETRVRHLTNLIQQTEGLLNDLSSETLSNTLSHDSAEKQKQRGVWESRYKLYKQMKAQVETATVPGPPINVGLTVTSSTSLTVTFQEPLSVNSALITRYKVEWSCLMDFSVDCGELILEGLSTLRCTITGLRTGQVYYVRVSAANMKGWGCPQAARPAFAVPSNWKELDGREARFRDQTQQLELLLKRARAEHENYNNKESMKFQNSCRKPSVSRSLKHLFHSSSKFVKTLKRGMYIAVIFHHKGNVLVTNEDQIPMMEIDDSCSGLLTQDFLWFSKLSCAWEEVRWLRQNRAISTSPSSGLQSRHKMLNAAAQLQTLLGTQNLGRVYYEPIKDRHGNVLLVTVRELETQCSFVAGKWIQIAKFQNQRKSMSILEEPTALDVLLITIQDVLSYSKRSQRGLSPGLYLGYLKLCSSVDQIKVLVPSRMPNMLCHIKVCDNSNVSREDWEWMKRLSEQEVSSAGEKPPLFFELQAAVRALFKHIELPLHQVRRFRVYTHEVLEFSHDIAFLLLLPSSDSVCAAPGQGNPFQHRSNFLYLPLQMFEIVHFSCYRERFMNLYCHVSTLLELDSLISQQALREAISDEELQSAKKRHKEVLESVQQLDAIWRSVRWIPDALHCARYKHSSGGLPITWFIPEEAAQEKKDSTSSHMDDLPSPSPSPENLWRKAPSGSQPCSDDDACSEVFLPNDSDYDSSDPLSPRELDLLQCPPALLRNSGRSWLSGSAPDVLQADELRPKDDCEEPSSFREVSEPGADNGQDLTMGAVSKVYTTVPTNSQSLSKTQPRMPRYQKYRHFNQNRWLCFHEDPQSVSLSRGVYTHRQEAELSFSKSPCLAQDLSVAKSTKGRFEESKSSVGGIIMDVSQKSSSQEELSLLPLSICSHQVNATDGTALETDCDELCDTQSSDIVSSVL